MAKQIKTVYIVHHSHTDIGYTDLQERVIQGQANYIRTVLDIMSRPENAAFRWNCETWFCVEEFLEEATPQEAQALFEHMKAGRVGFSATYLNFCDLVDSQVLHRRLGEACGLLRARGFQPKTAMCADINGISMGQRDALLDNGIEFLYTNIHCHHGMYPLYQNQTAYWWEAAGGRRLLVWNGEHYNLGNVLGLTPDRHTNGMTANFFGDVPTPEGDVESLHQSVESYLTLCEENGYPYDFILASVSGLFHNNAPPNLEILHLIEAYNQRYPQGVQLRMVSLQELYSAIREPLADSPVYRGDLTDWWANGVGSTPYAVKHYREAQRRYGLARRLEPQLGEKSPALCVEHGEVFTELRLCFRLPGTVKADVLVKFYEALPRVDFRLQLGKTLSSEIESVFLPMSLSLDGGQSLYLKKGGEAFRPGVDQLPGTCMEYSMSDDGLAYVCPQGSALIASYDVPLFYFGEMAHHPIRLCDNREENNRRPVYSWVMNNTWETNFKMDLSGFGEYRYTLWLSGETDPQRAMEELRERCFEPWPLITG